MKNKFILIILLLLLMLPLDVKADSPDVSSLNAYLSGNIVSFNGTTVNDSHAVMCKLFEGSEEIDKLSVEVSNVDSNGTFSGTFIAPKVGNYTVTCANYEGGTILSEDITVEEMTKFVVTFNTNGGSEISSATVDAGSVVTKPQDPTKDDLVFGGWFQDDTFSIPFDFSTKITDDTTLYASWVEEAQNQTRVQVVYSGSGAFQVDFDTDDPDNQGPMGAPITSSANYFVNPGTEVTLTAVPSQGQHFVGWYSTHEEEDVNNPGHMIWVDDEIISNNAVYEFVPEGIFMNIKPIFEDDTNNMFTVTFDTNGGSNIPNVQVESGGTIAHPDDPSNGDMVFVGWYQDDTFSIPFDFDMPITGNITIYAKWIEPAPDRQGDQIQVWAATGGKVAVRYTPSSPNVYDLNAMDGTNFVARGEVVQFYRGDEITAIAKADAGYKFIGWKHVDIEYGPDDTSGEHPSACQGEVFATGDSYTYKPGITVVEGDDEPIRYVCAAFEEVYEITDDAGNKISFTEEVDHTFRLEIANLTNLTDEQLEDIGMDRETYEQVRDTVVDASKKYGTLISFLEISVLDENDHFIEEGPFKIKLKITDEMKKYNSFKLIYVKDDLTFGDVITLNVEGDYLVGTLPHLSTYVLTGSTVADNSSSASTSGSPKTGDNIYIWFIVFGLSIVGLLAGTLKLKKSK